MTRERFELELLKIKQAFPADYKGACGVLYDKTTGQRCIIGELAFRSGAMDEVGQWDTDVDFPLLWALAHRLDPLYPLARQLAKMNDQGIPWHQIIDSMVPKESQSKLIEALEMVPDEVMA